MHANQNIIHDVSMLCAKACLVETRITEKGYSFIYWPPDKITKEKVKHISFNLVRIN